MNKFGQPVLFGLLASLALIVVYVGIMGTASGSYSYAVSELARLKLWIVPLVVGFGIQVGLYTYLKALIKLSATMHGSVVASTATSTTAMIACCAHHLTDVLPLIGLSVAATFLAKYQSWFLAVGILSNIVGIILLVNNIKRISR